MGEGCPHALGDTWALAASEKGAPPHLSVPTPRPAHLALDVEDEDSRGGHGGGRRTGSREGGRETTAAPLPSSCGSAGAGERSGERVLKGRPPGERRCQRTRTHCGERKGLDSGPVRTATPPHFPIAPRSADGWRPRTAIRTYVRPSGLSHTLSDPIQQELGPVHVCISRAQHGVLSNICPNH